VVFPTQSPTGSNGPRRLVQSSVLEEVGFPLIVIDGLVIAKWSRAVFADMRKGGLTGANCTCSIWDLRLEQVRNRLRAGGSRIRTIGSA